MKRCTYCGAEYSDEAVACAIDQRPLESKNPVPTPTPSEPETLEEVQPAPDQEIEDTPDPEYFRCLWRIDAVDAERVTKQFADVGIRFLTDLATSDQRRAMFLGYPPMPKVSVYVHLDDKERAMKILETDWKV